MSAEPQEPTELRAAAMRGVRWTMVARPLVETLLLGSMVVLSRLISPAEFGHYAAALLITGLGGIPAAAITTALVQRPTVEREHLRTGFGLALLSALVLVALMLLSAGTIVSLIFGSRTAELVRLASPGCLIYALGAVPTATLQRRLEFRRMSIIDVASTALRAVGTVALALVGLNGSALVLGVLGGFAAVTILSWWWAPPPTPHLDREAARDILNYALPSSLAAVSWIGFQNCDYAIVGARLGAVQGGLYFRAYTLGVEYQKKVSQVMVSVGFPVLARTRSSDELGDLRGQMVRLTTVLLFPPLALLAVVAPVAVPWLFGPHWRAAAAPTQVLAIGGAATLVIDAAGATLMAAGRPRALLGFGWAHFATYALAVFLSAPLGLTAVAASAAVVHSAFVFVAYVLMLSGANVKTARCLWRDVGPAFASSAALAAASFATSSAVAAIHPPPILYLSVVTLAGLCAYVVVLRTCFAGTYASTTRFLARLLPSGIRRSRKYVAMEVLPVPVSTEN